MSEPLSIFNDKNLDLAIEKSRMWLQFITARWLIVLGFCILGVIVGFVYAKKQKLEYESYLTFSLDEAGRSSGGGFASLVAQFGIGSSENDLFSGDNIVEVIKSRTILERVLLSTGNFNGKAITMIDYFNSVHSKKSKELFPLGIVRTAANPEQDSVLFKVYTEILKNNLIATRPDKLLNIYVIKFKSADEKFTKIFTDKILSETTKFYTELKTKKSESTLKILEERIASIKGNLNESITQRASTQDANINPAFAAAQVPLQKQQLNMQVYGAAYGELYKNLELARFQYLQDIPLLQIINNADYPMTRISTSWVKTGLMGAFLMGLFTVFFLSVFYWVRKN